MAVCYPCHRKNAPANRGIFGSARGIADHDQSRSPIQLESVVFSAFCIAIATLLYHYWCPLPNKLYRNFAHFKEMGKVGRNIVGMMQVATRDATGYRHICTEREALEGFLDHFVEAISSDLELEQLWEMLERAHLREDVEAEAFWHVWHFAEFKKPWKRFFVSLLYGLGFFGLAIIAAQNVLYVWNA